ncbi:hypothetical protein G4Z16_17230 [Streptomyces bathyalis]|uniref:Uncharacterized protein n=1 Tax=Streptomyces bathyalis TaxID=2710756 RepID=A0A7T1WSS4_9ACTN|nr:hypothetical protein [Streptomyces bathyalis]QPP07856.1 hypothetical protein G4Z16_17230 [Streptomyces bathyalis]
MADYETHVHKAEELIAALRGDKELRGSIRGLTGDHIVGVAQVEALLALAAAINAGNERRDEA